jgi:hypothetical protein
MNILTPSDLQRESTRIESVATALLQGKLLERPNEWYPYFNRDSVDDFVSIKVAIKDMSDGDYDKPFERLAAALESGDTDAFTKARTMLAKEYAEAWVETMTEQGEFATDDGSYAEEQQQAWDSDRAQDAKAHNASLRAAA